MYAYTVMCVAVRYVVDGRMQVVACGVADSVLPILIRSGVMRWVEWGAPRAHHVSSPDAPGYVLKLPEGHWVALDTLRAGVWWQYKPKAVKIAASAFGVYVPSGDVILERWIELKAGQYIQGALATVFAQQRVYVVTVTPPAEYAEVRPCWPRIVDGRVPTPKRGAI
jgi:hypothetical protein